MQSSIQPIINSHFSLKQYSTENNVDKDKENSCYL